MRVWDIGFPRLQHVLKQRTKFWWPQIQNLGRGLGWLFFRWCILHILRISALWSEPVKFPGTHGIATSLDQILPSEKGWNSWYFNQVSRSSFPRHPHFHGKEGERVLDCQAQLVSSFLGLQGCLWHHLSMKLLIAPLQPLFSGSSLETLIVLASGYSSKWSLQRGAALLSGVGRG